MTRAGAPAATQRAPVAADRLLAEDPGDPKSAYLKVSIAEQRGDFETAVAQLENILSQPEAEGEEGLGNRRVFLVHLGFGYQRLGRFSEAAETFARAQEEEGTPTANLASFRAEALYQAKEYEQSLAVVRQAREQFPNDPDLTGLEATLLRETGDEAGGVALIEELRRKTPEDVRVLGALVGGLLAVMQELGELPFEDVMAELGRLAIEPVMTAHPTEATRRTLLEKEQFILRRLVERLDASRTPEEETATLERIRAAVTSNWQTEMYPSQTLSVANELENVLFYLTEVLYRIVPPFYERLHQALESSWPDAQGRLLPAFLHFGSWVGGDMDGNPNVGPETIRNTLAQLKGLPMKAGQLLSIVDHPLIPETPFKFTFSERGFLGMPGSAMPSVVFANVLKGAGFGMILYLSAIQNIPQSLYEAADIDGASWWKKFRNITVPLLRPTTFFVVATTTILGLQVFVEPYTLMGPQLPPSGPDNSTLTPVVQLYQEGFTRFDQGYASALAWVLFIFIFGVTLIYFWRQRRVEAEGMG